MSTHHLRGGRDELKYNYISVNIRGVKTFRHDFDLSSALKFIRKFVEAEFIPAISKSNNFGAFDVTVDQFTADCLQKLFPDSSQNAVSLLPERLRCTDLDHAIQITTTCEQRVINVQKSIFSFLVEAYVVGCSTFESVWPLIHQTLEECCKSDVPQHVAKQCITVQSVARLLAKLFSDVSETQKHVEVLRSICSLRCTLAFDEPNEAGVSILSAISASVNLPNLLENVMVTPDSRISSTDKDKRPSANSLSFFEHKSFKADSLLVRQVGVSPLMAMILLGNDSLLSALLSKLEQDNIDVAAVFNTCSTVNVDVLERYFAVTQSAHDRLRCFAVYDCLTRFPGASDSKMLQLTPFIAALTLGKSELVKQLVEFQTVGASSLGLCTLYALFDAVSSGPMNFQEALNVIKSTKLDLSRFRKEQQIGFNQYSVVRLAQRLPAHELTLFVNELVTLGLDLAIVDKEYMKGVSIVHALCLFSPETEIETLVTALDQTVPIRMELIEFPSTQDQQQSSTCGITLLHCAVLRCFVQPVTLETSSSEVTSSVFGAEIKRTDTAQSAAYQLVVKLLEVYTQRPTINYGVNTYLLRLLDAMRYRYEGNVYKVLSEIFTFSELSVDSADSNSSLHNKKQRDSLRNAVTVVAPLVHSIMRGNFQLAKELLKFGAKTNESLLCYLSSIVDFPQTSTLDIGSEEWESALRKYLLDFAARLSELPNTKAFDELAFLTLKRCCSEMKIRFVSGFAVPSKYDETFSLTELIRAGLNVNARMHGQSVLYRIITGISGHSVRRIPPIVHRFLSLADVDVNVRNSFKNYYINFDSLMTLEGFPCKESIAAASAGCIVALGNDSPNNPEELSETLLDFVLRNFALNPKLKLRLVTNLLKYGAQASSSGIARLPECLLVPECRLEELELRSLLLACNIRLPIPPCIGMQLPPLFHQRDHTHDRQFLTQSAYLEVFYITYSVSASAQQSAMMARNKERLETAMQYIRMARLIEFRSILHSSFHVDNVNGNQANNSAEARAVANTWRDQLRARTIANLAISATVLRSHIDDILAQPILAQEQSAETFELMYSALHNSLQQPYKLRQLATFRIRAAIGSDIETRLNALISCSNRLHLPKAVQDEILLKQVFDCCVQD